MSEIELKNLLEGNNPKSYVSMIKRRPKLLKFVTELSSNLNTTSISETLYCFTYSLYPPKCNCGAKALFNTYVKGYRKFCSLACPSKGKEHSNKLVDWHKSLSLSQKEQLVTNAKHTFIKNYGVDNPMKSATILAETQRKSLEQFGVKSNVERADVKEKCKKTNLERYGVETPLESTVIQQKGKDTTIQRYGKLMTQARIAMLEKYSGKNPFEVEEVKEKLRQTLIQKYGKTSPKYFHLTDEQTNIMMSSEIFIKTVTGLSLEEAALLIGVNPSSIARTANKFGCRDLLITPTKSKWELLIAKFLTDNNIKFVQNTRRVIKPLELDFYISEFKLAIEVGSLYTHSEAKNPKRDKIYHTTKYEECKNQGITLLQYFDDEIIKSFEVVKSKILYHCKKIKNIVGARKIVIKQLTKYNNEEKFLNQNHIQGASKDRSMVYGGYYNQELIAVFAVKRCKNYLEITRFATKLYTSYPGLFTKMFKFAINELNYRGEVVSFSNNNHSNGNLYKQCGFTENSKVPPSYYYTADYRVRENRQKFMKQKIKKMFGVSVEGKTEWTLMQELGYDRIWDAGKIKWVKYV